MDLTPGELFAIDPHVFTDADGSRYLFFAHDVLEAERPGTHIAVARLSAPDRLDEKVRPVLAPNADWQRYQANRRMYGRSLDWHTLEGPTVVARDGTLFLFYSGGSWEGPGYGVSYATATSVLGPWTHLQAESPAILSSASTGLIGPGHNSVLRVASDRHVTAFHAWDDSRSRRQMYITSIDWHNGEPVTAT